MNERILNCLTLNSLTLNVGSLKDKFPALVLTAGQSVNYFKFADPEVSRIVAENWGDGTGTTLEQIEAVTDIGYVFKNNTTIETFNELNEFTGLTFISDNAFNGCSSLQEIEIGANVKSIGNSAFQGDSALSSINISEDIESVGSGAFDGCSSLQFEELNLPHLTTLGAYSFKDVKIKRVTNLGSITEINSSTFKNNTSLEQIVLPQSLTTLNIEGAFSACSNLKSIVFPDGCVNWVAVNYGIGAFEDCSSLIDVNIPEGVVGLTGSLFENCIALPEMLIPSTVEIIYRRAFKNCASLERLIFKPITPPELNGLDWFTNTNNCPIYVPDASVEAYKTATNWVNYADRIKSMFYYLGYIDFADPAVRDICVANFDTDADGVVSIEEATAVTALKFDWSTWQKFVTFNEFKYFTGVTILNFGSAMNLKEYICPPSIRIVEGIGPGAEKFTLNEGITEFRTACFRGNYKITNITIPSTTEKIGNNLFNTIPEWGQGYKGTFIFTDFIMEDNGYYKAVDGILYNSAQTMIQQFPAGRTGSYITPPGVSLQAGCFGNSELSKIEVDANVTTLPGRVFYHSQKLETIILNGVTSIKEHVQSFYFCNKLKSLIIKTQTVASLGASNIFSNDGISSGTAFIYVPSNLVDSYKAAENWSTYASQIKPINVADALSDISAVAENDLYKIGEVYWKAEMVDSVLTWVEI